jgi:hypothetical protein
MPNTQRQIRNKRNADMALYINHQRSSLVEQHPIKVSVAGSTPVVDTHSVYLNSRLQASSRKVGSFNMSKIARWKVARLLAVKGKILDYQLGFSFPVGLVRLPVVGGLFTFTPKPAGESNG